MPVGDVNSNERGSGARYNDGKPDLSLIPLWTLYAHKPSETLNPAELALDYLGEFQRTRSCTALRLALRVLGGGNYPLAAAARVFERGKQKYAAWNWAKGMAWSIPLASAARHLQAHIEGEGCDPESGEPHLGHAACNLFMLLHYAEYFKEGDDLPPQMCFTKPGTHHLSGSYDTVSAESRLSQWAYE